MRPPDSRWARRISGGLTLLSFTLYLGNVLQGKAHVAFGWQPLFLFGDVGEFLLLLLSAVLFTITILLLEAQAGTPPHAQMEEFHVQQIPHR